jgi:hypothetical protein
VGVWGSTNVRDLGRSPAPAVARPPAEAVDRQPRFSGRGWGKAASVAGPWLLYVACFVAAAAVIVIREQPQSAFDQGVFLSVMSSVSRGLHLYRDVFDNKDSLFYYTGAGAFKLLGARGPFIWDALLTLGGTVAAYATARRLGLGSIRSVICAFGFLAILTTPPFRGGLSEVQSLTLLLVGVAAALSSWPLSAGMLAGIAVFSRLSFVLFVPVVLIAVWRTTGVRSVRRFAAGLVLASAAVIAFLGVQGELPGYWDAIRLNSGYVDSAGRLLGNGVAPFGTLSGAWSAVRQSRGEVIACVLIAISVIGILARGLRTGALRRLPTRDLLTLASAAGVLVFLAATYVWWHYLQVLSIAGLFALVSILSAASPRKLVRAATPLIAVLLLILVVDPSQLGTQASHLSSDWSLQSPLASQIVSQTPASLSDAPSVPIAFVGENFDDGALAFLPGRYHLSCRFLTQWPWYGRHFFGETLKCIGQRAQMVVLSPDLGPWGVRSSAYREFQAAARRTLLADFVLTAPPVNDLEQEVWVRRGLARGVRNASPPAPFIAWPCWRPSGDKCP